MPGPLPWLTCGGRPLGQRALGLVLIFVTAVIWVAASFLSSALVSAAPGASALHAPPLLLTYLATSVFTAFLPMVHARRWLERRLAQRCAATQRDWSQPRGGQGAAGTAVSVRRCTLLPCGMPARAPHQPPHAHMARHAARRHPIPPQPQEGGALQGVEQRGSGSGR